MRYPRAFFIFEEDQSGLSEDYFQGISNSTRKVYLSTVSQPIGHIDWQIEQILEIDSCLRNSSKANKKVLVVSNPKVFDFLITYFSDKNLSLYWVDQRTDMVSILLLLRAIDQLQTMRYLFDQGCHHYKTALNNFIMCTNRYPHPQDDLLSQINAIGNGNVKTFLESEARVLLRNKLSMDVMNRIDLS